MPRKKKVDMATEDRMSNLKHRLYVEAACWVLGESKRDIGQMAMSNYLSNRLEPAERRKVEAVMQARLEIELKVRDMRERNEEEIGAKYPRTKRRPVNNRTSSSVLRATPAGAYAKSR